MQAAFITPPFGYNLFIMKGLVPSVEGHLTQPGVKIESPITILDIYRSAIPFVGIQAICLAVVMAFPQIAMWLPSGMFGEM